MNTIQPMNFATFSKYTGKNAITLTQNLPLYATFMQVVALGGKVKKGAKSISVFCGYQPKTDKKTGEKVTVPKFANVFHIDDCEMPQDARDWTIQEAISTQNSGI